MKPFCRPFLLACLVSLVAASCQAPPKPAPPMAVSPARLDREQTGFYPEKLAEIDTAINQTIAEGMIPGGVLWLERDGISYHKAYGRRAIVPASEPMNEETIFDSASLTKTIGGAPAIMLLLERGRLQLDELVQKHLPAFTGGGKEKVTLRHLLTHTSGLRSGLGDRSSWTGTDGALRKACEEKLLNPPGTFFRYSDINFILLGGIAEKVAGQRLNLFLERELYRPLKMKDTSYLPAKELLPRIAPTEKVDGKVLRGEVHDPTARQMGGVAGHAGVFTTASDLARYARMLLNGGELDGVRVLKPETVKLMTSVQSPEPVPARRGLGWDIDSAYSRPRGKIYPLGSYGHTGFTGTCLWIDPFSRTFWIFLSNRVHPSRDGNVLPLQAKLANLTAEAVRGFNFLYVPGALPPRASVDGPANVTAPAKTTRVLTGIDVMVRDKFGPFKGQRLGLITNHTGQDRRRNATIDLFHAAASSGVQLKALFSPEHGIRGQLDEKVADSVDTKTGLPVYSLYGERRAPIPEQLKNLDALVFDIQDVGCRFYTYISTLGNCMEAAEKAGLKFYVLDRVNPINGLAVEGPVLQGTNSFVAYHSIPLRHGMTVGELARMFQAERFPAVKLTVIPVENWTRDQWFDQATLPWTNPSPNMRSLTEAALYPGVGLLETAVSVGRGTDTPFEVVGAPYIDDVKLAEELNQAGLPGVRFAPIRFTPKASVFKDKPCGGVNLILTDRHALRAVDVGIVLATTLQRLHPAEFPLDKVNTLLQDAPTLAAIRRGATLAEIKRLWEPGLETFHLRRAKYLVYK